MTITNKQRIISLSLKLIVLISAIVGTILSALSSVEYFMGGETVFMYFTIQSNLLIAIVCLIGFILLILNKKTTKYWNIIKFVSTVSITLTGFVFVFVLAPTMKGAAWSVYNVLTYVVVPLFSILDFFIVGKDMEFKKKDVLFVIIPPILYAIYAGIGYINNWKFSATTNYPYSFLNWGSEAGAFGFSSSLPYMGVAYWILALLLFLIGIGFLYRKLNTIIHKKNKEL